MSDDKPRDHEDKSNNDDRIEFVSDLFPEALVIDSPSDIPENHPDSEVIKISAGVDENDVLRLIITDRDGKMAIAVESSLDDEHVALLGMITPRIGSLIAMTLMEHAMRKLGLDPDDEPEPETESTEPANNLTDLEALWQAK